MRLETHEDLNITQHLLSLQDSSQVRIISDSEKEADSVTAPKALQSQQLRGENCRAFRVTFHLEHGVSGEGRAQPTGAPRPLRGGQRGRRVPVRRVSVPAQSRPGPHEPVRQQEAAQQPGEGDLSPGDSLLSSPSGQETKAEDPQH